MALNKIIKTIKRPCAAFMELESIHRQLIQGDVIMVSFPKSKTPSKKAKPKKR